MRPHRLSLILLVSLACITSQSSADAQVVSTQRAGQGLPPGQVQAPASPGGMVLIGSDIWIGDGAQGSMLLSTVPAVKGPLEALNLNDPERVTALPRSYRAAGASVIACSSSR